VPAKQCRFALANTGRLLPAAGSQPPPVVILDPPRDGCSPGVIEGVFGRIRPATAVYVSCDPDSLARDLAAIAPHGYRVESLQPVDMFPHTPHIETVALLRARSS
jgi:23S rRNA (uracil1939-C5)-methyltransferase